MEQIGKELTRVDEQNEQQVREVEDKIAKLIEELHAAGTPDEKSQKRAINGLTKNCGIDR